MGLASLLDGGYTNETHPLAYSAGGQDPNSNILNHDATMKAVDSEKFEMSMSEELEKYGTTRSMRSLRNLMCSKETQSYDQYGHIDIRRLLMVTYTAIDHVSVMMEAHRYMS